MIEHDRVASRKPIPVVACWIVALSPYANALYAFERFKDGTAGLAYVLEDRVGDLDELPRAVDAVSAGEG